MSYNSNTVIFVRHLACIFSWAPDTKLHWQAIDKKSLAINIYNALQIHVIVIIEASVIQMELVSYTTIRKPGSHCAALCSRILTFQIFMFG